MKQAAGTQLERAPANTALRRWRQILRRSRRDRRGPRDGPPSFELQPERVDRAIVVKPHPGPSAALDAEQERALFLSGTEQRHTQRDDEAHEPGQHLMDLGEEDGRALVERPAKRPRVAGTVVTQIGGDLYRDATRGHRA